MATIELIVKAKKKVSRSEHKYFTLGGHESTVLLLLSTFKLSNLIVIKKLFLNFYF